MKFRLLLLPVLGLLAACSSEQTPSSPPANRLGNEVARTAGAVSKGASPGAPAAIPTPPSPSPRDSTKSTLELLQGTWQSTEDAKSVIELRGHRYIDYYDGLPLDTTAFVLARACPAEPEPTVTGDNERYLVQPQEAMCWEVVSVDDEGLELSYTARGNTLNYRRLKKEKNSR